MIISKWIIDSTAENMLVRKGYTISRVGDLIKKFHRYKTFKEILEKLCITNCTLQVKVAYRPEETLEITQIISNIVDGLKVDVAKGIIKNCPFNRAGIYSLYRYRVSSVRSIFEFELSSVTNKIVSELLKKELDINI